MKIAFTGPESSGKTSVSQAVAKHFDTLWFPEYAREYLMEREGKYQVEDITKIALKQDKLRKEQEERGLKIYDTENIVLYIWTLYKYNTCSQEIEDLTYNQQFSHYFLCSPDGIPWEDDPLREHPNQREELFQLYENELINRRLDYTVLSGSFEERVEKAIEIIEEITLSQGGFCF